MTPTQKQMGLGAAAVVAILVALQTGEVQVEHPDMDAGLEDAVPRTSQHIRIGWPRDDAGAEVVPETLACAAIEARGPSEVWAGLQLASTGQDIAVGYVAADQSVEDPGDVALPPGIWLVEVRVVDCPENTGRLELWTHRAPGAPARCACAPVVEVAGGGLVAAPTSPPCEWLRPTIDGTEEWAPAPLRTNLDPGRWRGGCVNKPACLDSAGPGSSLPVACGGPADLEAS